MPEKSSQLPESAKSAGHNPLVTADIQLRMLANNLQKAFNEEEGQYKGYLIDPTITVSAMLGKSYRTWRPSEAQLFNLVEGSTINTLIHQTRKDQMLRVSQYNEYDENSLGWRIVHKDNKSPKFKEPPDAKKKIEIIRSLFERPHKLGLVGSTYSSYLNMFTDFCLTVDKVPTEILRVGNKPAGFAIYDPCTIRPVLEIVWKYYENAKNKKSGYSITSDIDEILERESERYIDQLGGTDLTQCSWVQYYNEQLVAAWTEEEMIVSVNNPVGRMDLRGYGVSRAESSILALDAWLKAWGYNVNMFTSGMSLVKGILAAVGNYTQETVDSLKMNLESQVRGPGQAGRFPIIGVPNEKGLQWIRFDPHNQEMEFMQWLDYCTSLVCGIYRINPQELNLASRSQAFSGSLMSGKQDQLVTQSKEEGWHSLLIESAQSNSRIIAAMGPDFEDYRFIYTGLDAHVSEKDKAETLKSKDYMVVNEKRATDNLDPKTLPIEIYGVKIDVYEHSDEALKTFVQICQAKIQADQVAQMSQMGEPEEYGETEQTEDQQSETQEETPETSGEAEQSGKGNQESVSRQEAISSIGKSFDRSEKFINIKIVKNMAQVESVLKKRPVLKGVIKR